jgi:hypothetical protein
MRLLKYILSLKRRIGQCMDGIDSFIRAHLR